MHTAAHETAVAVAAGLFAGIDKPGTAGPKPGGVVGMSVREQKLLCVDARQPAEPVAAAVNEQPAEAVRDEQHAVPVVPS